jgi:hypothetical protein
MLPFIFGFAFGIAVAIGIAWMAAHMDSYYADQWEADEEAYIRRKYEHRD